MTTANGNRRFKVALVAIPWSFRLRPSAAIAALTAFVRQRRPHIDLTAHYSYVDFAHALGEDVYDQISFGFCDLGELLYLPLLYPERREAVAVEFLGYCRKYDLSIAGGSRDDAALRSVYDKILDTISRYIDDLAERLVAEGSELVGMTTSFGQLFGNILLARALRLRRPSIKILLGGSTVSDRVGVSILREFPEVDFVIQGEGELPLVALIDALETADGTIPDCDGLLAREGAGIPVSPAILSEVIEMDSLPIPYVDEYATKAEELGFAWILSVEGSRGCWWDRTRRSENPKATCYFCNLNVQWKGYREKSVDRVVDEVEKFTSRYGNLQVFFLDNIMRSKGATDLGGKLKALGRDLTIFYELRANLKPIEFVALWEAGLDQSQFGIEALSTSLLRRIGKGTTLLQNLQAMRLCEEFGVDSGCNLIFNFPGATREEVDETIEAIELACGFQPPNVVDFRLGIGSTVDSLRQEFPITNVRNNDALRAGFPPEVFERIQLFDLSFDLRNNVDWTEAREKVQEWRNCYYGGRRRHKLFFYLDGGSFLTLCDHRYEDYRQGNLVGLQREVYLYCMQIRSADQILDRFADSGLTRAALEEMLELFTDSRMIYGENDHYLSLAVASSSRAAAERIRAAWERDQAVSVRAKKRVALSVT